MLPYEDEIRGKVLGAVKSAYPSFMAQLAAAPKQGLMDLIARLKTNPVGYMSESLLGGIGGGGLGEGSQLLRGVDAGVDAADELSGMLGYGGQKSSKMDLAALIDKYNRLKS